MAKLNATNNAYSELASGITDIDTSLTVNDSSLFPDAPFLITLDAEIIEVGAIDRTNNIFSSLTRGQEGTTAATHDVGARVENRLTAGTLDNLYNEATNYTDNHANSTSDPHSAKAQAIEWAQSFGLGTNSAPLSDANTLGGSSDTGFYNCAGALNTPSESGALIHIGRDARPVQLFMDYASREVQVRSFTGNGWEAWRKLAMDDEVVHLSGDIMTGPLNVPVIESEDITTGNKQIVNPVGGEIYFGNPATTAYLESSEQPKTSYGGGIETLETTTGAQAKVDEQIQWLPDNYRNPGDGEDTYPNGVTRFFVRNDSLWRDSINGDVPNNISSTYGAVQTMSNGSYAFQYYYVMFTGSDTADRTANRIFYRHKRDSNSTWQPWVEVLNDESGLTKDHPTIRSGYLVLNPYGSTYDDGSYFRSYYDGNNRQIYFHGRDSAGTLSEVKMKWHGDIEFRDFNGNADTVANLKSSVSNGKIQVRDAITGKGGSVSDSDGDGYPTFQELTDGVNTIPEGSSIKSKQSGYFFFNIDNAKTPVSHNITINSVDVSKSVVIIKDSSTYQSASYVNFIRGSLSSSTQLELYRDWNYEPVMVHWEVIEFDGLVSHQSGLMTITTDTDFAYNTGYNKKDITINAVNPAKAMCFVSYSIPTSDSLNYNKLLPSVVDSTTLRLVADDDSLPSENNISYYVIEFK